MRGVLNKLSNTHYGSAVMRWAGGDLYLSYSWFKVDTYSHSEWRSCIATWCRASAGTRRHEVSSEAFTGQFAPSSSSRWQKVFAHLCLHSVLPWGPAGNSGGAVSLWTGRRAEQTNTRTVSAHRTSLPDHCWDNRGQQRWRNVSLQVLTWLHFVVRRYWWDTGVRWSLVIHRTLQEHCSDFLNKLMNFWVFNLAKNRLSEWTSSWTTI